MTNRYFFDPNLVSRKKNKCLLSNHVKTYRWHINWYRILSIKSIHRVEARLNHETDESFKPVQQIYMIIYVSVRTSSHDFSRLSYRFPMFRVSDLQYVSQNHINLHGSWTSSLILKKKHDYVQTFFLAAYPIVGISSANSIFSYGCLVAESNFYTSSINKTNSKNLPKDAWSFPAFRRQILGSCK